jgi:hypothetical protein
MENLEKGGHIPLKGKLPLNIEGQNFEWDKQFILGKEVKVLGKALESALIYLSIAKPWEDELIGDDDKVDLARPGIESFYFKYTLKLIIDGKSFEWDKQYITGTELRRLAGIDKDRELFLAIEKPWEDERILDDTRVDLAREGIEHFYSKKQDIEKVVIYVDDQPRKIHPGERTVTEIKKVGEVSAGYELDQVIGGHITPLKDDAVVCIEGGERFISHVKDGTSS